jgi:hypothetical protein
MNLISSFTSVLICKTNNIMKTKNTLLKAVTYAMAGSSLLSSCEKKSASEVAPTSAVVSDVMSSKDVVLKDGVLVFKDRKAMKNFNSYLNAKGVDYANQWEKSLGFESMAHILRTVTAAENKLEEDFLKGKSDSELAQLRNMPAPHSALYTKWVSAGTLRVVKDATGAESFGVNASHDLFTNVLNSEGIVAFGDTVYQFKGHDMKMTTKGLANLVALQSATQSDRVRQIVVKENLFPNEQRAVQASGTANRIVYNAPTKETVNQFASKEKITMRVSLYSNLLDTSLPDVFRENDVDFWYEAEAEKKNFWGNWNKVDNGSGISGLTANYSWDAEVRPNPTTSPVTFNIPGYSYGYTNVSWTYLATSKPNIVKFDYSTGAPQFGNQTAPNGRYGQSFFASNSPDFAANTSPYWSITRGLLLRTGTFTCYDASGSRSATVNW